MARLLFLILDKAMTGQFLKLVNND